MNTRYKILGEIGQGGMAVVYLAVDTHLHSQVALKVLRKEMANNSHIHKRFVSEARSMFRMAHPNIIKVIDLIDDTDTVAIVMEYVEGETLKQFIERKKRLNDTEIKDLLTQMLDALGYVHEQGMVHRDIKPSNFMITSKGKIKLMDFGIAKNTDPDSSDYTSTGTTQQMGTPMYMSPEQVHETKSVTAQSDIYSFGVVLWQMVTGNRPYDTQAISNFQLQSKIVNEPLPATNSKWDKIIFRATEKKLGERYQSTDDFFMDFKDSIDREGNLSESTVVEQQNKSGAENRIEHSVNSSNTNSVTVKTKMQISNSLFIYILPSFLSMMLFNVYNFYYFHLGNIYLFDSLILVSYILILVIGVVLYKNKYYKTFPEYYKVGLKLLYFLTPGIFLLVFWVIDLEGGLFLVWNLMEYFSGISFIVPIPSIIQLFPTILLFIGYIMIYLRAKNIYNQFKKNA